ncbi:MAG: hypothetical protein COU65_00375 [Candidatus Pacebacteria bacterium CG10_big_fil_rev_8_21_14_0_10_42_12]|nr:MAG: hypothetical protein COU65_00375 [Candidatus Pacebacteria bacterium CG10_big_fil_rev_8_21_14_0_10_42_12]
MKDLSKKDVLAVSSIGALIAGLCCFSPLVLVLLGLATTSFASSLSTTFYEGYKWYFRLAGLAFIVFAYLYWYVTRTRGCSLDVKAKVRKKMLNLFLLSVISFVVIYVVWLYVIVEFWGVRLSIWEAPAWATKISKTENVEAVDSQILEADAADFGQYTEYSQEALDATLSSGKEAVLFFHAPWCPTCRSAEEDILVNISSLPSSLVIFKTDFDSEDELKNKYGIVTQHTFVLLDSDKNLSKSWVGGETETLLDRLNSR